MTCFENGKIYKITSSGGLAYIGSTCLPLKTRFRLHLQRGKNYSVAIHLGQPDIKIELIEKYPCNNHEELIKRERYWTEMMECCNKRRPYRSRKEQMEYQKEYYRTDYWVDYQKKYQDNYYRTRYLRQLPFYKV